MRVKVESRTKALEAALTDASLVKAKLKPLHRMFHAKVYVVLGACKTFAIVGGNERVVLGQR